MSIVPENSDIKNLIDLFFSQPNILLRHLYSSYHQFIQEIIPDILENDPNSFYEDIEKNKVYTHGFICKNIRIRPVTFQNNKSKIVFPKDARKNHLNYFSTIDVDIEQYVDEYNLLTNEKNRKIVHRCGENEAISVANIPIMVGSKFCSTKIKKDLHGECKYDHGGYFIVNGQEKIVISIERMIDNKPLVFKKKSKDGDIFTTQINSRVSDWSDNLQIMTIKEQKDKRDGINILVISTSQIHDVPLVIFLRALGLESDRDIIANCCYSLDDINMINLIKSSIDKAYDSEGNFIRTKEQAMQYLMTQVKRKVYDRDPEIGAIQKKLYLEKIISKDILPHLGDDQALKIRFIGRMVNKMFKVMLGRQEPDDRDNLDVKRVEPVGVSLGQLFRQNWKRMLNKIGIQFRKKGSPNDKPINVISFLKSNEIEQGIKKALSTGIWGVNATKKGIPQALSRDSWFRALSLCRKITSPQTSQASGTITELREVNNLQYQFLCPAETPEGQSIGIVKSLAMTATVTTQNLSQKEVIDDIIDDFGKCIHPYDVDGIELGHYGKVIINGAWLYITKDIGVLFKTLKTKRRQGIIDRFTTFCLDYQNKELNIFYDGGRLIRPVLIVDDMKTNFTKEVINEINRQKSKKNQRKSWDSLLNKFQNLIEYEDIETTKYLLIAGSQDDLDNSESNYKRKVNYKNIDKVNRYGDYRFLRYTHCDIHPYLMLGLSVSTIPFSNHNYGNRDIIYFSHANQAFGIFLTNYKDRMDASQMLYHPQKPLVTTWGTYITDTDVLGIGENAIVAIACYSGYNQEDSVIVNESAVKRGLFRGEVLRKYSSEIEKNPSTSQNDIFTKPDPNKTTGYHGNYDNLNDDGYAPEETEITSGDIIIGKISPINPTGDNNKVYKDNSIMYENNADGVVDRVYTDTYNSEGYNMYSMRVRSEREPIIGDKFCLTPDHEVLTMNGWKNINEITFDDEVCCLDRDQNIYYSRPLKLWEFDHSGEMYSINTENVNMITTMNHKMYVRKYDSSDYSLIEAKDIYGKRVSFKKNGNNANKDIITFKIPNTNHGYSMDDLLIFIGNLYGNGFLVDAASYKIGFYMWKSEHIEELYRACNNMNIVLCEEYNVRHSYVRHYVQSRELYNYFSTIFDNDIRSLPRWVFKLSNRQTELLYTRLLQFNCYQTKTLINETKHLALHCGMYTNNYSVKTNNIDYQPEINVDGQDDEIISYTGKVYCIEVPDHVFYIRRNGIPVWTGNSNREGQKGTVGILLPQKDMPFTEEGIVPDIIMNPHSIPTRMTVGQIIECMASKISANTGEFFDGTPFNNFDVTELPKILKKLGYDEYGCETMYCGMTGEKIQAKIFIGPTYYLRLRHMVLDKIFARATGSKQPLTRQPQEGRTKGGGLKIGTMENDSIIAHGTMQFGKECMMEKSDIAKFYICDLCGRFASKAFDKNYYECTGCKNSSDISAVTMPYACKLMFQELASINIQPKIITKKSKYKANL